MAPKFTVDWEAWHDALHLDKKYSDLLYEPTLYLLDTLKKYRLKAIFYILQTTRYRNPTLYNAIVRDGHIIKTHGVYHYSFEKCDRKPYKFMWFTGGFWFRFFPYWLIKKCILFFGQIYLHPHDIMEEHPILKNPILNWKRQVGLKTSRKKLQKLLSEVHFD